MNGVTYLNKFRKLHHVVRQLVRNRMYGENEEFFWDQYVKDWEKSERNKSHRYLGTEWKNEEDFLSLLDKYSSREKKALEIGCGGGRITASGVKLFKHVYAADLSQAMLNKSRESIIAPNISFHKLDGFTLNDFADESIDFVYSHDVFIQLSSIQVYPYLREVKRVLTTNGIGLISFYDFVGQFDFFKELSVRFWNQRKPPVYRRVHFLTEEMLRVILSDLKLDVLEVQNRKFLTVAFRKSV